MNKTMTHSEKRHYKAFMKQCRECIFSSLDTEDKAIYCLITGELCSWGAEIAIKDIANCTFGIKKI